MYNICRAFTLYNDFALPGNTEINPGEYLSFGYYDGISVSGNLFQDVDGKYTFSCLWDHCVKVSEQAKGTYLSQTVYAFRTDESREYEENFWLDDEDGSEYPFLFFSFVQLDRKSGSKKSDSKISNSLQGKEEFEKRIKRKYSQMGCKVIAYLTLDSSDLILVIRCKEYETGARIIDDFHSSQEKNLFEKCMGRNIGYCYTVASIKRDFLNDQGKIEELTNKISSVHIYMIERTPRSIQTIYNKLQDIIDAYGVTQPEGDPILGCNDEVIILKDIPWKEFLIHYKDKKGCLNHSSEVYANNLVEVTTTIGTRRAGKRTKTEEERLIEIEKASTSSICEKLLKDFRKVWKNPNIAKSVTQMLCSLRKFENEHFPPYLYSSLIRSVDMMVNILMEAPERGLADNAAECFWQCQKAFYLSVQNAGRVDRQFTQMPDFDMKMYDVPVKLVIFFIAYINEIKEYLSEIGTQDKDDAHKYEFLFCPGGVYSTQVSELFRMISENNRMFLVEIPEHQIYNIKLMLIMLGHEVAHIVGKEIRKREERKEKAIYISAKIVTTYMKNALRTWKNHKWKECIAYVCSSDVLWQEIENEIVDKLQQFLEPDFLREYLGKDYRKTGDEKAVNYKIERLISRSEYSTELSYLLAKGLQWTLESEGDKLWERIRIRSEYYLDISDDSDLRKSQGELQEKIHQIVRKIVIGDQIDSEVFSAINTISMMMDVLSESFADLVVVLITRMSCKDYMEAALVCQEQQNFKFDTTEDSEWLLRMGLVVACMDYLQEEGEAEDWDIQKLEESESNTETEEKVKNALYNFVKTYFYVDDECSDKKSADADMENEIISGLSVLYNADILREMLGYLVDCKRTFKKAEKERENRNLSRIREMYQLFDTGCEIQKELLKMQKYIDDYVSDVLKQKGRK